MKFNKVTIAIGATDECTSLTKTITSIVQNCNREDIECILVVVSKNATKACLETVDYLMHEYPSMLKKLVQQRMYIGGAMQDAIDHITSSHLLFFASDLSNNLEIIPKLIEKAKQTPDVITKTSRWIEAKCFYKYNFIKKIVNFLAQDFLRFLFKSDLTDFTNPVLIAPTEIYKKINFKELNFPCLLEAVLVPLKMGCKINEIPVKCYARTEGKSKNSVLQTALFLKTAIRIKFTCLNKLTK